MGQSFVPRMTEHGLGKFDQAGRRFQRLDEFTHFAFDLVTWNGFAIARAGFRLAEIVSIGCAAALGPRRAERRATVGTGDAATQSKVIPNVGALGRVGRIGATRLDFLECLNRDQRLMMALEPVDAVVLRTDVTRVERIGQNVADTLLGDFPFAVSREGGLLVKEAPNFGLGRKVTRGVAFEGIAHDRGQWLIKDQHFAVPTHGRVFKACWSCMDPVTRLHASLHLLRYLPPVLFAFQLALCGHDGLNKLPFGRGIEIEVQTLSDRAPRIHFASEFEMEFNVSRIAFQIVEDDDVVFIGLCI